jgi:alpha-tubulin suppressor-like RCC1 family protein
MVACGNNHTLFLTKDREVFAAGVGEYGRLGTGDTSDQKHPVPINTSMLIPVDGSKNSAEEEDVTAIAAGPEHSLLLTAKGKVASWGRNMSGQLGHGDSYMDMYSMEDIPRPIDLIDDDNSNPTQVIFKQITEIRESIVLSNERLATTTQLFLEKAEEMYTLLGTTVPDAHSILPKTNGVIIPRDIQPLP